MPFFYARTLNSFKLEKSIYHNGADKKYSKTFSFNTDSHFAIFVTT